MADDPDDRLYFRQLLSGRDFATTDPVAQQMANFAYAIGDRDTGECLLVDPAYAVDDVIAAVTADGMTVTGVLATHYHADHVGGTMMGYAIEGIANLLERIDCPIHVQRDEVPWVRRTTGVGDEHLAIHDPGDVVRVGSVDVTLVHTPGHTPGSQCFHVRERLVSGDTLFLDGCGRTDLPGSNPEDMYYSLQKLAALPAGTEVYPGHRYSPPPSASLESIRQDNFVFRPRSAEQWLQMFS
jgi:glyoxylase-like metal-dependent hydrolase (beta-lactamase superfamily II)